MRIGGREIKNMGNTGEMEIIAKIHSAFPEKFGIPRQSGLVRDLRARVVFEPEYRDPNAVRGLEGYSHIWLLWQFSESARDAWSPMVRPPRLNGNRKMGVFATRSPFRPNPIGLSSVRLERVELDREFGPVLHVLGADMMDGTPVYDIKPYLPFTDSHPEAVGGFADGCSDYSLKVEIPEHLLARIPEEERASVMKLLSQDPRPSYKEDGERVYGMAYGAQNIRFYVKDKTATVCAVEEYIRSPL